MFLPSVPVIAHAFGTEPGVAQYAVTTYLLGLALGQLVWGPVSDRFGRKPALLCGLALFLLTCAWGAAAQSAQEIAQLRFAQGIGMSSGPVIARSIVRDLYAREQAAQLLARMAAVFGIIPIAAPLAGGQAIALGSWPAVFWLLGAIALALLCAAGLGLRETAPALRPSIAPARIAANYALLLGDARFRAALATMLPAQLGIIAFVSSSALAMVEALGLTPTQFSVAFAVIMVGQIIGALLGSRLVARLGIGRMARTGAALVLAGGLLLAALAWSGPAHWSAVVVPMIVFLFGCAFMIPSTTAAALAPFPEMAGAASSLLGVLPFGLGAAVSAVLAVAFDGSTRPMALAIGALSLLAFLSERLLFRTGSHG
jgi:DHA1 family bicyclomycin/chloramphenicol resistance-like MFS transporter